MSALKDGSTSYYPTIVFGKQLLLASFDSYESGASNPADILSKAWGYQQVWLMLKALLLWEGDTSDLIGDDE